MEKSLRGLIPIDPNSLTVAPEALLQAMGCPAAAQTAPLRHLAEEALRCAGRAAAPQALWRKFELVREGDALSLGGTAVALPGGDIAAHLRGCGSCIVFAVTLGLGTERYLAGLAADPAAALYADTACSLLIEEAADYAEGEMPRHTTWRYSPGYGDLPLTLQGKLLSLLDAPRRLGLTLTDSGLMLPRKSITAIVGCA